MTESRADDSRERDRSAVADPQKLSFADRRQARKDLWEAVNKALNTLMVGHAAGLVTCLTLIKDSNNTPQLKGLVGWFTGLFGLGLVFAVFSAVVWIVNRVEYVVLPIAGKRLNIPHGKLDWTTAALALLSTVLMVAAILFAVFKFGTL
jgi:hypothetical protein